MTSDPHPSLPPAPGKKSQVGLLLVAILIGFVAFHFIAQAHQDYNPADIGLGIATTTHEGRYQNRQVGQAMGGLSEVEPSVLQFQSDNRSWVLWIGNSQLHGVNYFDDGDEPAVVIANQHAQHRGSALRYIQLSSPNLNLSETLIYLLRAFDLGFRPNVVVLGLPFRSYQLTGIRPRFVDHIRDIEWDHYQLPTDVVATMRATLADSTDATGVATSELTAQQWTEERLINLIESIWPAYRHRHQVRSRLRVLPGVLYQQYFVDHYDLVGSPEVLAENLRYLDLIMALCESRRIPIFYYQPPHPSAPSRMQYNMQEYQNFFRDLEQRLSAHHTVRFESFETLVPVAEWGLNERGWLDVFHFKGEGHRLLGSRLDQSLSRWLVHEPHASNAEAASP